MSEDHKKPKTADQDIKLKELKTIQGPIEAEVIKSLLESEGIPCIMRGLVVQSVHAFSADGLGKIKILVAEEDFLAAKQLLEASFEE